ncbi:hypothetical protein RN001_009234 [Aquatica leii]|uniref:Transgelin n=1 Tax=Aquatica leii TaxID=1421715 RepID=A0AAN7P6C6_9COLE|nr:hypothetical protein RN001_009234 [Aquatica leii]
MAKDIGGSNSEHTMLQNSPNSVFFEGPGDSSSNAYSVKIDFSISRLFSSNLISAKMANNRATKSGFAAEAQRKINAKYSDELAQESLEWVKEILGDDINVAGDMDNFYEVLKDGQVLCRMVNTIKPGIVKKVNQSSMAFKCMENINAFLEAAKELGVPAQETFQTVDLWERQNLNSVVICLQSLGRKAGNYGKPTIGPKEADKNERHFSEEKLRAGQTIIGLQMGSNKGATQSGINMGNTRHM